MPSLVDLMQHHGGWLESRMNTLSTTNQALIHRRVGKRVEDAIPSRLSLTRPRASCCKAAHGARFRALQMAASSIAARTSLTVWQPGWCVRATYRLSLTRTPHCTCG